MAALDLKAERDKIQKEIEALERSLGPNAAALNVDVLDSNDDTDDDLDEQLDGDCQRDDVMWEDGGSSAEVCLQMNLVYQAVIEEKLQELEVLIAQNKEQQEELMWELAGRKTQRAGTSKPYPLNLALGHFTKPYFKDKVIGVGPPANQEMRERNAHIVKTFQELTGKRWRSSDALELRKAVFSDTLQRMLQPKMLKVEYLQQKQDIAKRDIEKKILSKQIQEAEHEIDDINQLQEDVLLGQRTDIHDWDKIANINFEGIHTSERLCRIWQSYEHPHINKEVWSAEEIQTLKKIAMDHNYVDWQTIAQELGTNRTAFQCLQVFQRNNKDFKRSEFSKEEDEMLTHFVQRMRVGEHIPYNKISYFMEGRDCLQLLYRWTKCLDPSLRKGPWSKEEDEMLLKAVAKHGEKDWYKIRLEVPGRSDVQCRERYLKGLHKDVKKGKWSHEEKERLVELTAKYGVGHWAQVSRELPHRTGSQCLSKWKQITGYFKRRRRQRLKPPRPKRPPKLLGPSETPKAMMIKKEMGSEEETSSGSSSSESSFISSSSSSESEDEAMELMDRFGEAEISNLLQSVPDMDLWIPKKKTPGLQGKSVLVYTASSSNIKPSKTRPTTKKQQSRGDTFQFNTILKGIAYPPSTDTITETVEDFLKEAEENGREILEIKEEDIITIIMRNTRESNRKWIQRIRQRQSKPFPDSDSDPNKDSSTSLSKLAVKHLYRASVDRKLLCAVTRWVGNVLLPLSSSHGRCFRRRTRADEINKKLRCVPITSTPIFTLLIQFFQIDAEGCMQTIRLRKVDESEFLRRVKNTTKKTARKMANLDSMSPKSILVQSFNDQEPNPVIPQMTTGGTSSPPQKRQHSIPKDPRERSSVAVPKPKTVSELLKEKRLQKSNAAKAVRNTTVLSGNILVAPQMLIQQPANSTVRPRTMVLPVVPTTSQNGSWPVRPITPMPACQVVTMNNISVNQMTPVSGRLVAVPQTGGAQRTVQSRPSGVQPAPQPLPHQVTLLPRMVFPAPSRSALPVTFFVTPQGLISVPTQALPYHNLTQQPGNQSPRTVSTISNPVATGTFVTELSNGSISTAPSNTLYVPAQRLPATINSIAQQSTVISSPVMNCPQVSGTHLPKRAPWKTSKKPSQISLAVTSHLSQDGTVVTSSSANSPQVTGSHLPTNAPSEVSKMPSLVLPTITSCSGHEEMATTYSLVNSSSCQTSPVVTSSLKQDDTLVASSVRSQPQLDSNCLPKFALAPGIPNKASQLKLTPQKYPIVKIAKLLQTNHPKDVTANVASEPQCSPVPNNSNQTANSERKILDMKYISLEDETSVKEWLQGKQGVEVPKQKSVIRYLPPSICTLKTFSRILLEKKTLEENAFKLLPLSDVTEISSLQMQASLGDMVEEKLKDNSAYQLIKHRFLSAFTIPGFLAVLPPTPVSMKEEDRDEDTENLMDSEMNMVEATHKGNYTAADSNSVGNICGGAAPTLTEQETALHYSAEKSNSVDTTEVIRTRRSVYCRPVT